MIRLIAAVAIACCSLQSAAQRTSYSAAEIDRLASLGKLWGMLHYFHPHVLNGSVVTDSLVLPAARQLAADPSAATYQQAVAAMLARVADPATKLILASGPRQPVRLLTQPQRATVHPLPGNRQYIALPTDIEGEAELAKTGFMDDSWKKSAGIVLDLRKADYQAPNWSDQQFLSDFFPAIRNALLGKKKMPSLQERVAGHNGFVSQTQTTPNVYSSGWRSNVLTPSVNGNEKAYGKPFVFVLHQNSHAELIWQCLLLSATGVCQVLLDGTPPYTADGTTTTISLSDALSCQIRISDVYTGTGRRLPPPADVLPITDTSLQGGFVKRCVQLLQTTSSMVPSTLAIGAEYVYPKPARYGSSLYPDADLRLMALYNWWNAIHYFFPYKHLTDKAWDTVLYQHIPMMLQAKDSVAYMLAVRSMVSDINDSHGFILNMLPATPARALYGYWPPIELGYIENKLVIVDVGRDSTQDMSQLQPWDEILAIDGTPAAAAAEKWRRYIASSNQSTYYRDVVRYLPNGPKNSKVTLQIRRNGVEQTVTLLRSGRTNLPKKAVDFNQRYATLQTMQDSVLYVNMGSLNSVQADSLAKVLHKQQVLLLDMRNYPQGTAWTLAPRLTSVARKAVLFDKPFVTPAHIFGGETQENTNSWFTVQPADQQNAFRGRVFILCNEQTQSQAEYSIMMFQGATQCTVVGSQTAGADGNVTQVAIPGGYEASFSGLGILYPDGTPTQRRGIRVDVQIKPTIEGLKAGKDEVLQKALLMIAGR
ncbi:MAG: S41 family peptidase [Chitinophagaceae bacterium]|nr:S41 family peptidase [Chitinophagaceae bacterium]